MIFPLFFSFFQIPWFFHAWNFFLWFSRFSSARGNPAICTPGLPLGSKIHSCAWIDSSFSAKVICHHSLNIRVLWYSAYSITRVKRPLSKRQKIGFQDQSLLNAGQKYCRILQGEHSAILSTFIKLPFVIKTFVLSIFEWLFYCTYLKNNFTHMQ